MLWKKVSHPQNLHNQLDTPVLQRPYRMISWNISHLYLNTFPAISFSIGSLEYRSNVNSGYQKWIEDLKITSDWIHSFPTTDIFLGYMNYCKDYNFPWMGKKIFYKTLENDFRLTKQQKAERHRHLE